MVLYGVHLSRRNILKDVEATGADAAQVFLGSPRTWAAPPKLSDKELAFWASYELPMYVHSSYLVNPASNSPEVRSSSATSLTHQFRAASEIKAKGLVIHAGQASGSTLTEAASRWKSVLDQVDLNGVQLLVENTAGGEVALGRSLDGLEVLWESIADYSPKLCLDTCHAWAGNVLEDEEPAAEAFDNLMNKLESKGIDVGLVHLNGSIDARHSGRDRHTNLTVSSFPLSVSRGIAERAGVPAILETPGPLHTVRKELDMLRS